MKRVLIPTDFSSDSFNTIDHVLKLLRFSNYSSYILLLNTYLIPSTTYPDKVIEMNDQIKQISEMNLKKELIKAQVLSSNQLISIETSSRMGTLYNVISELTKNEKFDIVAMGKDGGKHIQKVSETLKRLGGPTLLVGSNTSRVYNT
ncbi:MAG: universal stress protein [Bacteriovoracaceae bacterium]|nr:universal stress protein [Bacteriovoracaceae bacterium]